MFYNLELSRSRQVRKITPTRTYPYDYNATHTGGKNLSLRFCHMLTFYLTCEENGLSLAESGRHFLCSFCWHFVRYSKLESCCLRYSKKKTQFSQISSLNKAKCNEFYNEINVFHSSFNHNVYKTNLLNIAYTHDNL